MREYEVRKGEHSWCPATYEIYRDGHYVSHWSSEGEAMLVIMDLKQRDNKEAESREVNSGDLIASMVRGTTR